MRALTLARSCDAWTEAITGNYLKVRVPGRHAANQWLNVRLGAEDSAEEVQNWPAGQLSKITSASARFPLCVMDSEIFFTPRRSAI